LSLFKLPFLALLLGCAVLLNGCGKQAPAKMNVPKDIASVAEGFLKEMKAGNKGKAESYISEEALDEFSAQYNADQKKLAAAPALTVKHYRAPLRDKNLYSWQPREANIVYSVQQNGKWTTARLRLLSYEDEPYKIEYIRISNEEPSPQLQTREEQKGMEMLKEQQSILFWVMGGLAILCAFGLTGLIWLIKRKPKLFNPENSVEHRHAASTVRDEGGEG
jgi:hypothetical protein